MTLHFYLITRDWKKSGKAPGRNASVLDFKRGAVISFVDQYLRGFYKRNESYFYGQGRMRNIPLYEHDKPYQIIPQLESSRNTIVIPVIEDHVNKTSKYLTESILSDDQINFDSVYDLYNKYRLELYGQTQPLVRICQQPVPRFGKF